MLENRELVFVTGTTRKFENAKQHFKNTGIKLIQEKLDTIEIQSTEVAQVAKFSAKDASKIINKPLIKVDVGFSIEALKGFPGPYIKFINDWLEPKKILKLMKNEPNRNCYFESVVACYIPGKEIVTFSDRTYGKIIEEVQGENGWGIDRVFMPDGYQKTLGEMSEEEQKAIWSYKRWEALIEYLKDL